ncbi:MAG: serine hydrolase domain-containing protein [Haliscomenobacter sp.]|uniref:serine hydrolase domain-containing protein n=1 Tax=Haliscomenobacter sp. TaxID=2717303 RepID=UPI0029AC5AD8|nr:serine hydrolase domain-containing protein [Haliscomenobacter sp.]MDX2070647.1 serine hydrolase domain-containing protein [Haliscomenobacter sp.]
MFKKLLDNHKLGGLNCLFWKNGQIVYLESSGYKNLETQEPMNIDTLFRIASMTKPITAVLTMMLWEEQKLDLSDPITQWFPQFRHMQVLKNQQGEYEDAKRQITVLDLLTHRAGFTYSEFQKGKLRADYLRVLGGDIDSELTNEHWINGLASLPLVNQPGELFNYGRSSDLLGILLATIEGKPLSKVMEEKIFAPLGMSDTFFEVPDHKKSRCASNFGYDESGNLVNLETVPLNMAFKERPPGLTYESGGQGLWSTIGDYLKFATLFAQNGSSNGVQLLKPESIDTMCTNQLTATQRAESTLMDNPIFSEHYGFGMGLAVVMKESKYGSIPCSGSLGSVGWPGSYGGWWSADPVKKTVSLFLTHSMTEPQQIAQGIGFELYEAIDIFSNFCKKHS